MSGAEPMITVIDVFKAMRLEPSSEMTWAVGAAVRDRFQERFGRPPEKELRTKTAGGGSHCFAVYPVTFRPLIEECISRLKAAKAAQPDLFDGVE